uniref:Uncharacterized protein n=1 Tax=Glossina austeni TaxID=7395 RepID=A0A1A9VP52_GLOAU
MHVHIYDPGDLHGKLLCSVMYIIRRHVGVFDERWQLLQPDGDVLTAVKCLLHNKIYIIISCDKAFFWHNLPGFLILPPMLFQLEVLKGTKPRINELYAVVIESLTKLQVTSSQGTSGSPSTHHTPTTNSLSLAKICTPKFDGNYNK